MAAIAYLMNTLLYKTAIGATVANSARGVEELKAVTKVVTEGVALVGGGRRFLYIVSEI